MIEAPRAALISFLCGSLGLLLLLAGCATPWPAPDSYCQSDSVLLDAHFDGGQLGKCSVLDDGTFNLELIPENRPPINISPWYAFRVSGQPGDQVRIRLTCESGYVRYWPKLSHDGDTWMRVDTEHVSVGEEHEWMVIDIPLEKASVWIAGQELLTASYYQEWIDELDSHDEASTSLIGQSVQGRPIVLAATHERKELILMMGRQHAPEVTGVIAMRAFVRTVLSDTELARRFRERFMLAIVPLVNPDGVAEGHWRHNVNGVDVNRDWGPFTQPESQAVIKWIEKQEAAGINLALALDFHSTKEDLFYTQPVLEDPPDFASSWLGSSAARLADFPFEHSADPVSEQANSKNYFHTSRNIPAITYESGDETSRESLRSAAVVFAEEMMREMLDRN